MTEHDSSTRRPIASRSLSISRSLAEGLVRSGVSPNTVSVAGIVFALIAALLLAATGVAPDQVSIAWAFWGAALCIQLRLLSNMLDGMVAVEGGKGSATGPLFNEVPDRLQDLAILVGAGWALGGSVVAGFTAALTSLFCAYVRVAGASLGAGQDFKGLFSKPRRMFLLTVVLVVLGFVSKTHHTEAIAFGLAPLSLALFVIALGATLTSSARLVRLHQRIRSGSEK